MELVKYFVKIKGEERYLQKTGSGIYDYRECDITEATSWKRRSEARKFLSRIDKETQRYCEVYKYVIELF